MQKFKINKKMTRAIILLSWRYAEQTTDISKIQTVHDLIYFKFDKKLISP